MRAIVVIFLYGASQLPRKQGYELSAETGAFDRVAFAHAIIRHQHL